MDVAILIELESVHGPNLIPELYRELVNKGHRVVACGLCQSRLGPHKGFRQGFYFLKVFGLMNTVLFFLSALLGHLKIRSFSVLRYYQKFFTSRGVPIMYSPDPNHMSLVHFFKNLQPDVVISLQGWILKKEMLSLPRIGVVNKHASLLPWQRGLLPFFWARLQGMDLGVSYHLMTEKVDEGPLLFQEKVIVPEGTSLLGYYLGIYRNCPAQLVKSLDFLADNVSVSIAAGGNYCSLPERKDFLAFKAKGFRMVQPADLKNLWVGT